MARTNDVWETGTGGTYILTISPAGFDILINGTSKYLNFNTTVGSSGYGIRDNAGTMEFKNSGGSWTGFGSGGSSLIITEIDGSPSGTPTTLKFSNGSVVDNGDGSFTVTTGAGGGGDFSGPGSATDNAIVRFDGTGGKTGQNSTVTIGDTGGIASTIADTGNAVGLTLVQNDVTNNPRVISITNAGTANAVIIDQNGNTSASVSVGGALLVENTGNTGAGVIIYSNQASPSGRLLNVKADNATFNQDVVHIDNDGTADALSITGNTGASNGISVGHDGVDHSIRIAYTGSTANIGAAAFTSTNDATTVNITNVATGQGALKITHTGTGTDANSSAISIDLAGTGTAAQGLFITSTGGGTTGPLINAKNDFGAGAVDVFKVTSAGVTTIKGTTSPVISDGAALGTTALQWSDVFLASGAVIDFSNGNAVITHSSAVLTVSTGDLRVTTAGTNAASVVTVGGTQTLTNKTLTSPVINTGTVGTSLVPTSDDSATLGDVTHNFSDLFLATGAVINYANGNVVLTHTSGIVTMSTGELRITTVGTNAASVITVGSTSTLTNKTLTSPAINTGTIGTSLVPTSNDGAPLGNTTNQFSDLFLAEGGVINWDNGDATITQTGNDITIAGITTFGVGTSTAVTLGTIELGAASDTTLSRSAAGTLAVEGVDVLTTSNAKTLTSKTMIATSNVVEEATTTASDTTPDPTGGSLRNFYTITALAGNATFSAPSGSPADGNYLTCRIKDDGTARTLAWNAIYRAGTTVILPVTTTISKTMYVTFRYNSADSKWDLLGVVDGL